VSSLHPAVAEVRVAVRRTLTAIKAEAGQDSLVLVACSGGPDSMALAAATSFVAPRVGLRAGLVTVDHGLQEGSAERAADIGAWAAQQGFNPVEVIAVEVGTKGGPEAAAREARYAALDDAVERHSAVAVLLGHTRDDQAETVLLALARGAGLRGLAGMPPRRGPYHRPFLELPRAVTAEACTALGLKPWRDPHNSDPAYTRARVRALLPTLQEALGPGFVANLARTARLAAADADVLDRIAARALVRAMKDQHSLDVETLAREPDAIRGRILHGWARRLGAPGSALSARHVEALDALVTAWRGQGPVYLPGGIQVRRVAGCLRAALPAAT